MGATDGCDDTLRSPPVRRYQMLISKHAASRQSVLTESVLGAVERLRVALELAHAAVAVDHRRPLPELPRTHRQRCRQQRPRAGSDNESVPTDPPSTIHDDRPCADAPAACSRRCWCRRW